MVQSDLTRHHTGIPQILQYVNEALPRLVHLLAASPQCELKTQYGSLKPPLGPTRLKVVELVTALVQAEVTLACDNLVCPNLVQLDILSRVLDLFFQYHWNNLLHGFCEAMVHTVLDQSNPTSRMLQQALLGSGRALRRFVDGYTANARAVASPKGGRLGYMGHLIRICQTFRGLEDQELAAMGACEDDLVAWRALAWGELEGDIQLQQHGCGEQSEDEQSSLSLERISLSLALSLSSLSHTHIHTYTYTHTRIHTYTHTYAHTHRSLL
jgi:hypothetical protein